jgi:hypothetical protein
VVKLKGRNIDEVTEVVSGTYLTPLRSAQNSDVVSKIGSESSAHVTLSWKYDIIPFSCVI